MSAAAGTKQATARFYPRVFKLLLFWRNFPHMLSRFELLLVKTVLGIPALGEEIVVHGVVCVSVCDCLCESVSVCECE